MHATKEILTRRQFLKTGLSLVSIGLLAGCGQPVVLSVEPTRAPATAAPTPAATPGVLIDRVSAKVEYVQPLSGDENKAKLHDAVSKVRELIDQLFNEKVYKVDPLRPAVLTENGVVLGATRPNAVPTHRNDLAAYVETFGSCALYTDRADFGWPSGNVLRNFYTSVTKPQPPIDVAEPVLSPVVFEMWMGDRAFEISFRQSVTVKMLEDWKLVNGIARRIVKGFPTYGEWNEPVPVNRRLRMDSLNGLGSAEPVLERQRVFDDPRGEGRLMISIGSDKRIVIRSLQTG